MGVTRVRGVPSGGGFAPVGNLTDAGDGTYATWTDATRRGVTTTVFSFDYPEIPAGVDIVSVSVEFRHFESSTADVASVTVGGVAATLATAVRTDAFDWGTVMPATLNVVHTRGNNTRSTTCSMDWLDVVVTWSQPPLPVAGFAVSPNPGVVNKPIRFTDVSLNRVDTWAWEFPGGVPSSASTAGPHEVVYAAEGTYPVTLTVSNVSGNDADTVQVVVEPPPAGQPVWNGTAWVVPTGVWNGTRWADAQVWNGTRWVPFTAGL